MGANYEKLFFARRRLHGARRPALFCVENFGVAGSFKGCLSPAEISRCSAGGIRAGGQFISDAGRVE